MYVTPFLRMALEEEIGHGEGQPEPPPDNSEYEEGEGLPVSPEQDESEQSNPVSDAHVDLVITEEPVENEKGTRETDPLRGGACAEPLTPTKQQAFANPQSKMSIEDVENGDESPAKHRAFDRKCAVIGVLLLLVIIAGAIGAVFINKFSAKVSYSFRFSSYYHDDMVLQRAPNKAVIWGYGPVSKGNVSVLLTIEGGKGESEEYSAKVRGQVSGGVWRVVLDPIEEKGPFTIRAKLEDKNTQPLELKGVLFGDVWICAGQRNMEFPVNMLEEEEREKAVENSDLYSEVRLLALRPHKDFVASDEMTHAPMLKWSKPTREALMGGSRERHQYFSALCWLYGKKLHDKFGYPIGLVTATYYSSAIEDWIPPVVKDTCDITVTHEISTVYNTLIRPLQSTSIYGVIWYQGENDAEEQTGRHYDCSLVTMINEWRSRWYQQTHGATDPTFPVGIVQLGAYRNVSAENNQLYGYTDVRWQQTANYGFTPNPRMNKTFMAVALDLPDIESRKLPRYKSVIADRLVQGALSVAYQQNGVVHQGPFPSKYAAFRNNQSLVLVIDTIRLEVRSDTGFEVCCAENRGDICPISLVKAVYIPGREWVPAQIVKQSSQSVTLSWRGHESCNGRHMTAVRYLWQETPCGYLNCAVYDSQSGLPMAPYITQELVDDGKYHVIQRLPTNHTLV